MSNGWITDKDGTKCHYLNDQLHREDGPAKIWADGDQEWWVNGQRHREDGPAIVRANGSQEWWVNGDLHREDGPAEIYANGSQCWYFNGQRHREDGPARIWADGSQFWYINDVEVTKQIMMHPETLTLFCKLLKTMKQNQSSAATTETDEVLLKVRELIREAYRASSGQCSVLRAEIDLIEKTAELIEATEAEKKP